MIVYASYGDWNKLYSERKASARDALAKNSERATASFWPMVRRSAALARELVKLGGEGTRLKTSKSSTCSAGFGSARQQAYDRHFRTTPVRGARSARCRAEGLADYTRFPFRNSGLFYSGRMPLDVALIQVTPPDKFGFCSLGVSVEAVKAAAETPDW
jgi:4-hydroxybutyrate CoA-transferase